MSFNEVKFITFLLLITGNPLIVGKPCEFTFDNKVLKKWLDYYFEYSCFLISEVFWN